MNAILSPSPRATWTSMRSVTALSGRRCRRSSSMEWLPPVRLSIASAWVWRVARFRPSLRDYSWRGCMQSHRSNRRRHAGLMFIVSLVLAVSAMRPTSAVADGALAVALPDDVVKKGFAYGYVTDSPDADKADAEALKKCRDTTIAG